MQVSKDQLIANLLAAHTAIENVLLMVNGVPEGAQETAPENCTHPKEKRRYAMGGYWECPCGATGRDTETETA
jgi:hypothetical protein